MLRSMNMITKKNQHPVVMMLLLHLPLKLKTRLLWKHLRPSWQVFSTLQRILDDGLRSLNHHLQQNSHQALARKEHITR
jgi:G:T/U-mismatch repair DNA glycosylase